MEKIVIRAKESVTQKQKIRSSLTDEAYIRLRLVCDKTGYGIEELSGILIAKALQCVEIDYGEDA